MVLGPTPSSRRTLDLRYIRHHEHTQMSYLVFVCIFRDDVLRVKDVIAFFKFSSRFFFNAQAAAIKRTAGRVGQTSV